MEGDISVIPFIPTEPDSLSSEAQNGLSLSTQRSDSPLRKRARRRSSNPSTMDASQLLTLSPQPDVPQRDPKYYMADGSCVLRVANTLFNVHRSILSADSSSFSTLFTLPQGDIPVEGTSDDNPIILQGDTPEEFRNFLWSLYALPHEIMAVRGPRVDLNRLTEIAKVASKYSFKATETWALDAIQEYVERKPSPLLSSIPIGFPFSPNSPPSALLESKRQISCLIRLAQMCAHKKLLDSMIALLRQLMSVSLHFSYLAMSLADELDLRDLRGLAYLEVLQRSVFICHDENGDVFVEGDVHETADGRDRLVVSPAQQLRLLSGYHRLSRAWERLHAVPIPFDHAPSCGTTWHQHGCTQSWSEFWKEKTRADGVLSLGAANVIGRLQVILKEFDKWGSATYMHHDCKSMARRAIQDTIKRTNEALPDYFHEGGEY
ncbi:hypothetical protein PAXRUDRAFT_821887 [Paxillus rubicundulus Ve08.2h10]|uniref:BTB domain-containing protein n=1 Tax=Paxillus rubicundulus Ve08.2h10 TaxID=930991 RepID=A0A0D0DXB4_9AGAM|nr:hypothetical protein PAXRUDRAFT_821887 [Paxillus rubicundulus Ve08.2h10]